MFAPTSRPKITLTLRAIVVWHGPVAIERNPDLTTLRSLEFLTIELNSVCMRQNHAMADSIRIQVSLES